MLHRSDKQGRPLIQILILRDWDNNKQNLLTILGGIDKEGNPISQERIDLITNTIEGLRAELEVHHIVNESDFRDQFV